MGLALLLMLIAFVWLANSFTIPTGWPALAAVATLAFWWGVVLVVPDELRRLFTILMIIGTIWVVGAATVFTVIQIRVEKMSRLGLRSLWGTQQLGSPNVTSHRK
jgi:hypothetical protein